jgi:RNA polymerase sigma-70 factor, ECF subfamily
VFEDDKRLARRLLEGDHAAFDSFFERSAQRLANFVMRRSGLDPAAAEDIVQNAMIKALRSLQGYRGEASLFTWMCEICRSELANYHQKAERRAAHVSLDTDDDCRRTVLKLVAAPALEPQASLDRDELAETVLRTLRNLPERYARILEWKYGDDLSVQEIGHMLGVTTIAAQSLLARARDAFRDAWRELEPGEATVPRNGGGSADA